MQKWTLAAYLVAGVIVAGPAHAGQGAAKALSTADYVEIQQIYQRYQWSVDAVDGETWANQFTADGEYEGGPFKAKGRQQLLELPSKSYSAPTVKSALHFVTNVRIEPSAEGARGGAYMLLVTPGEAGKPPTVSGMVVYEDVLVKTPAGWRIKSRKTHGSDAGLAPSLIFPPSPK